MLSVSDFNRILRVVKPGKQQIFTACDLFSVNGSEEKLVANGETLLCVV